MPKIWPVLAQGFTNVFTRLGIQAAPAGSQWFLSDTLIPVTLVDSDITLAASVADPAETMSTQGLLAAPVANTLAADTGQLAAGKYKFVWHLSIRDGVNNNNMTISHRDAPNTGSNFDLIILHDLGDVQQHDQGSFVIDILQNERVRIVVGANSGAGSEYTAWIQHALLPSP